MATTAQTATNNAVKTARKLTFLNAPVITAAGVFSYEKITPATARRIITEFQESGRQIESAVGHEATAETMTKMLKFPVNFNRTEFQQSPRDIAIVFRLNKRAPEGKVMCCQELEDIGFELGLLTRIS